MTQRFLADPPMPDIAAQWHHYFSLLGCRPGDRVLDVGCDTGDADHLLLALVPTVRQIVGLDKTTVARDLWRARGAPSAIAFVMGDGAALPVAGEWSDRLYYLMSFDDLADRERKWAAFQADPDWQQGRAESEKNGPLVARLTNTFLRPTPYSPGQS